MTDLLDRSITESLARIVAQAPPAGPMPTEPGVQHPTDGRRRPWLLVAAAVVVLVGVGGIVAVAARPDPAPIASSEPPNVQPPAGVFPYGGTAGALAAGYPTPVDAVNAYLVEITDPSRLPAGYTVRAQVADLPAVATIDADHAVVSISLETADDSGDGRVAVQRVQADPDVWQVTSAEVISGELRDVRLADGSVSGSIAVAAGGTTVLYAYDLASGGLLDSTTVTTAATQDGAAEPVAAAFTLQVGGVSQVGLRYWNTVAPAGGYAFADFADRVVAGQGTGTDGTAPTSLAPASPAPTTTGAPVQPATPGSNDPTSFPVLDDVPAGLTATASTLRVPAEDPWTEALVGRMVDGNATDTVAISVYAKPFSISSPAGSPPTQTEVWGQPATVYDYGSISPAGRSVIHVKWGSGPYFVASGEDPLAFLAAADQSALQASAPAVEDQPPTLTIGPLPQGFEVLVAAQPRGQETMNATLSIGQDNFDLSVATRSFVVSMAQAGALRPVDVGGRTGWAFVSSGLTEDITWQVDDHTFAYLKVNDGTGFNDALALAAKIGFVDWATFAARYNVELSVPTSITGG